MTDPVSARSEASSNSTLLRPLPFSGDSSIVVHMRSGDADQPRSGPAGAPAGRLALWVRTSAARRLLLVGTVCVYAALTLLALRRTSVTFDEIVMVAAGARGYEIGAWDLVPDHPPMTLYLYGLPAFLTGPHYPNERGVSAGITRDMWVRYGYAQVFYFRLGNDAERLAFFTRLPAVLCGVALILLVYACTRRAAGGRAALLAAGLTAFLPDLLAHGGVAYNDVPGALTFLAALWALDEALRRPTPRTMVVTGLAAGLALGFKLSAVALAPVGALLFCIEALRRRADAAWWRRMAVASVACPAVFYLTLVLVYRGDFALSMLRYGVSYTFGRAESPAPAFLLGESHRGGFWYYFPVAFFLKTSAGLHALLVVGLLTLGARIARAPARFAASRLRVPAVACATLVPLLLTSHLNLGFRYALPVLPLLCVLAAAGTALAWRRSAPPVRAAIVAAGVLLVAHPVSYFPHFLAYVSEYGPGRDRNFTVLADSSLDWGQGLLDLRDFMRQARIPCVYLSYFGSGLPDAYGIEYVALPSYFELPARHGCAGDSRATPKYAVISATTLAGLYVRDDPFAALRAVRPVRVLGHSLCVFKIEPPPGRRL